MIVIHPTVKHPSNRYDLETNSSVKGNENTNSYCSGVSFMLFFTLFMGVILKKQNKNWSFSNPVNGNDFGEEITLKCSHYCVNSITLLVVTL